MITPTPEQIEREIRRHKLQRIRYAHTMPASVRFGQIQVRASYERRRGR